MVVDKWIDLTWQIFKLKPSALHVYQELFPLARFALNQMIPLNPSSDFSIRTRLGRLSCRTSKPLPETKLIDLTVNSELS